MKAAIYVLCFGLSLLHCSIAALAKCAFEDTVNLTSSERFSNGSYLYEGVLVSPELTDHYDHIELFDGTHRPVESHIRGCVCQLKPCVKFCCHPRSALTAEREGAEPTCRRKLSKKLRYSPRVNITLRNSSQVEMHLLEEFVVQQGIACANGSMLMPHKYEDEQWELFENGSLLRTSEQKEFSRLRYCLHGYRDDGKHVLLPWICPIPEKTPVTPVITSIVMAISAPFLCATALIYWLIPELWNLHTKCLICYLLSLAIGTTILAILNLLELDYHNDVCAIIGFVAYYFLTAVFFWLNIICFNLWHSLSNIERNYTRFTRRNRYLYYSLYAWGLPALMTILTILLQNSDIPDKMKPGIGVEQCWLKVNDWSAMIYFHGPCLFLIIFNLAIFYLTAKIIYSTHKELRNFSEGENNSRHLRSQKNDLLLFLRLFIVMGIGWLLEIVGYMVGNRKESLIFFAIVDFYNGAQGLVTFVVFVMKKNVLLLIKRRVVCTECADSTDATKSQHSEEEIVLRNVLKILERANSRLSRSDSEPQSSNSRTIKSSDKPINLSKLSTNVAHR